MIFANLFSIFKPATLYAAFVRGVWALCRFEYMGFIDGWSHLEGCWELYDEAWKDVEFNEFKENS